MNNLLFPDLYNNSYINNNNRRYINERNYNREKILDFGNDNNCSK